MKLKNVSFFQLHAEKFIALLMLLIFLVTLYFYGINTPNVVEIGNQPVAPGEVDGVIEAQAQQLSRELSSDQLDEALANLEVPSYTLSFTDRANEPLLQDTFAIAANQVPWFPTLTGSGSGSTTPYIEPSVPTPTLVASSTNLRTIEPIEVEQVPGLSEYFSGGAPYDVAWVSLVGQFDVQAMLDELMRTETEEARALPENWWERTFAIADVQVERQEMRPDGTWPQYGDADYDRLTAMVEPIPGQRHLRDQVADFNQVSPTEGVALLQEAQRFQEAIIQPGFYTLVGQPWTPPDPADEGVDQQEELLQAVELKEDIDRKEKMIEGMEIQIRQLRTARGALGVEMTVSEARTEEDSQARGPLAEATWVEAAVEVLPDAAAAVVVVAVPLAGAAVVGVRPVAAA